MSHQDIEAGSINSTDKEETNVINQNCCSTALCFGFIPVFLGGIQISNAVSQESIAGGIVALSVASMIVDPIASGFLGATPEKSPNWISWTTNSVSVLSSFVSTGLIWAAAQLYSEKTAYECAGASLGMSLAKLVAGMALTYYFANKQKPVPTSPTAAATLLAHKS